jgi:hypothetical protein
MKRSKNVLMTKRVAMKWLKSKMENYYQVTIYNRNKGSQRTANLLKLCRDGKLLLNGMKPIPDLGIKETFDGVVLSSSNHKSLTDLEKWFESNGYITSGVF